MKRRLAEHADAEGVRWTLILTLKLSFGFG